MTSLAGPACPSPDRPRRCWARARASRPTWSSSTWRTRSRPWRRRRRDKVVAAIRDQDWGEKVLCVRVNDWSTRVDRVRRQWPSSATPVHRLDEIMLPKVETAAQVVAMDLLLAQVEQAGRAAGRPHRHRGADRDRPRPDQRRGDLRRLAPAGDDHLRPGRLRGLDGDARAHRRRADPDLPGRPLPLRVLQDPHGRAGPTACRSSTGRTSTSATARASATTASAPGSSATTASGRSTRTR